MSYASSQLGLIYRVAGHVADGDTLDEELASVVEFAVGHVDCEECYTYVRQGNLLLPWVWKHQERTSLDRAPLAIEEGFAAALFLHRAPVATVESSATFLFKPFPLWPANPGVNFVAVPLLWRANVMGAITLHHYRPRPYTGGDVRLLSTIGYVLGAELRMLQLEKNNGDLVLELETRKLVERSRGILQRDLGLSAHDAYLALQRQSEEKQLPMKKIAQAVILGSEIKQGAVQTQ